MLMVPFVTWLKSHLYLRNIGSLWLFCVWEVVSSLLPQERRVALFTGCATLFITLLAGCATTNRWGKVAASLAAHLVLAWLMAWKGLL
jgi:hypothetical protein